MSSATGESSGSDAHSAIILPGSSLMGNGVLAFFYLLALIYIFLGVAIISDIFMK